MVKKTSATAMKRRPITVWFTAASRPQPGAVAQMLTTVALGVLLDTMIVRSVLVTALNLDLGGKIWWPSKLDSADTPLTESEAEAPLETVH